VGTIFVKQRLFAQKLVWPMMETGAKIKRLIETLGPMSSIPACRHSLDLVHWMSAAKQLRVARCLWKVEV
jgi:hypothetical protein